MQKTLQDRLQESHKKFQTMTEKERREVIDKNKIDTVIFDIGGVLTAEKVRPQMIQKYGLDKERERAAWHQLRIGACDEQGYWKQLLEGTPHEGREEELEQEIEYLYRCASPGGAYPLLVRLHFQGYHKTIAILSDHSSKWGRIILESFGLDKLDRPKLRLDGDGYSPTPRRIAIISAEVGCHKPERKIYDITLQRVCREEKPYRCLFIDDKPANIVAARERGMHGIVYTDRRSLEEEVYLGMNTFCWKS